MAITDETVFSWIIASLLVKFLWEFYLDIRQHRVYKEAVQLPDALLGIMNKETYEKARVYAEDKSYFGMIRDILEIAITVALLYFDGFYYMWMLGGNLIEVLGYKSEDQEILQSAAFITVSNTFNIITKLPFSIYYTFVLEEKHGFNKQTAGFFIKDKIKGFILGQVVSILIGCGLTWIVKAGGTYFFVYLWLFAIAITLFFMTIYPDFIAPLFDKYTPLEEGELRTQIENLAASIQFPLTKIFVVEGSKRSSHSNAYFYGFYKNKRIVLFDTLLKEPNGDKGCDNNEILAVLGHELGHWKLNHILKNLVIMQVNMFFIFYLFNKLFQFQPMYGAIGFHASTPVLVGLLVLLQFVLAPYFAVLGWGMALLSRHFEFQADGFAKMLGRCHSLKTALIKLNTDNLSFPVYDPWYSSWHNSHPPLLERLSVLDKDD